MLRSKWFGWEAAKVCDEQFFPYCKFFHLFNVWLLIRRKDKDQYLSDLTRENVQLIVNALWEQPTERVEECIVAKLPAPSFVLPRSRKCPVPRALTKWEQFALEKGIKKTKKDKKVFDQELDVCITFDLISIRCGFNNVIHSFFFVIQYRNGYQHTVSSEHRLNVKKIGCLKCHKMPIQWKINLLRKPMQKRKM